MKAFVPAQQAKVRYSAEYPSQYQRILNVQHIKRKSVGF